MRIAGYRLPLKDRSGKLKAYALVDAEDKWATEHRWHMCAGYAARSVWDGERNTLIYLHRQILGLEPGDGVDADHMNRDKLDNRRANLRAVSHRENQHNMPAMPRHRTKPSQYRGVSWRDDTQKWTARCQVDGQMHRFGCFDSEEDAAQAAREGRRRLLSGAVD